MIINGYQAQVSSEIFQIKKRYDGIDNYKCKDSSTLLIAAAHRGHLNIAKLLLKHGADINAKDDYEWRAIDCAAYNNDVEMRATLLNHERKIKKHRNKKKSSKIIKIADYINS